MQNTCTFFLGHLCTRQKSEPGPPKLPREVEWMYAMERWRDEEPRSQSENNSLQRVSCALVGHSRNSWYDWGKVSHTTWRKRWAWLGCEAGWAVRRQRKSDQQSRLWWRCWAARRHTLIQHELFAESPSRNQSQWMGWDCVDEVQRIGRKRRDRCKRSQSGNHKPSQMRLLWWREAHKARGDLIWGKNRLNWNQRSGAEADRRKPPNWNQYQTQRDRGVGRGCLKANGTRRSRGFAVAWENQDWRSRNQEDTARKVLQTL